MFFAADDESLNLGRPRGRPVGVGVCLGPFLGGRPTGRGVLTTTGVVVVVVVVVGRGERSLVTTGSTESLSVSLGVSCWTMRFLKGRLFTCAFFCN